MALRTWINRVSKLVRRIFRQYGGRMLRTIISIGLAAGLWGVGPPVSAAAADRQVLCVLVPHFKDEYWLSVGFGLEEEARKQNVELLFFEAGGYRARATQIAQLERCAALGVDAILIGAVSSDHPDLTETLAQVSADTPVFGLINEIRSDALSARIGVDWTEMGHILGTFLRDRHPSGSEPKTAVLLTGPAESGWTGPLEAGLRDGLAGSTVTILDIYRADTGLRQQLRLAEEALEHHPKVDYLIGSAPAIEAAIGLFASHAAPDRPQMLATYVSHTIKRSLMNGNVLAASFDDPMFQARLAMLAAVSEAPGQARVVGPEVRLLRAGDETLGQIPTSPAKYFPTLQ
ncbi:TMAO reductase system periplasmic protein TorT [Dinoroseobacter shibae]